MSTRRKASCEVHFWLPILFLSGWITSCAPILTGPIEPSSSLVIGRVVINNKYGGQYGLLPLGIVDQGIEVQVQSRDGRQEFQIVTQEQGYFIIPNIPPNTYYIERATLEGSRSTVGKETYGLVLRQPNFTPVPGKIRYIGTLFVELSERGVSKVREVREDDRARAYFFQKHPGAPWASREFVVAGPGPVPGMQVTQEKATQTVEAKSVIRTALKAQKPEWKVGYEWRYSWKGPAGSGTFTREIIREDTFEGVPCYVMRSGRNENFYVKEILGLLATMSRGRLTFKADVSYQILSWPLEVGKEWRNTYIRENIEEKSSQTFDFRIVVAKIEEVRAPAGIIEAFKIEVYGFHDGNLRSEFWYSPQVKWFVKERLYQERGVLERELISFKVD